MAEHGTPDLSSSQAPFIQALVQKSVTAITKLAGRLSFRMLREQAAISQGANPKKLEPKVRARRLGIFGPPQISFQGRSEK